MGSGIVSERDTHIVGEPVALNIGNVSENIMKTQRTRATGFGTFEVTTSIEESVRQDTLWLEMPGSRGTVLMKHVKHGLLSELVAELALITVNATSLSVSWNRDGSLNYTIVQNWRETDGTAWQSGIPLNFDYVHKQWDHYYIRETMTASENQAAAWVNEAAAEGPGGAPKPAGTALVGFHGPHRTGVVPLGQGRWLATVVWGKDD